MKHLDTDVVYFIRRGHDGPVKIGRTISVSQRLKGLQNAASEELAVIRTVPGASCVEAWLHRHFRNFHTSGEWFAFNEEMLSVTTPIEADLLHTKRVRKNRPPSQQAIEIRQYILSAIDFLGETGRHNAHVKVADALGVLPRRIHALCRHEAEPWAEEFFQIKEWYFEMLKQARNDLLDKVEDISAEMTAIESAREYDIKAGQIEVEVRAVRTRFTNIVQPLLDLTP